MADPALDEFYSNPELLEAIKRNQQYATGQQPTMPTPYIGPQIPKENSPYAPDANSVINILKGVGHGAQDIFERMKRGVTQGPYSSPTGEYDPRIGLLGPEVMLPGVARVVPESSSILGAFGSGLKRQFGGFASAFTPEMRTTISTLAQKFKDVPGKDKQIINAFRERYPDFKGADSSIRRAVTRSEFSDVSPRDLNQVIGASAPKPVGINDPIIEKMIWDRWSTGESFNSIAHAMRKFHGLDPKDTTFTSAMMKNKIAELQQSGKFGRFGGGEFELGAMGGRGRGPPPSKLNTENASQAIDWLKRNSQYVDSDFVRNWAKDAGVPFTEYKAGETNYITLKPSNAPPAKVRVPSDPYRHSGAPENRMPPERYFDTGQSPVLTHEAEVRKSLMDAEYGPPRQPMGGFKEPNPNIDVQTLAQSGEPYAKPHVLEPALELATGQSRTFNPFTGVNEPSGFKLVSPDYAHRLPEKTYTSPPEPKGPNKQLNLNLNAKRVTPPWLRSTGVPLHNDIPLENPYSLNEKVDERLKQQEIDRQIIEHQDRYRGKAPHNVPAPQKGNLISTYDILKALYGTP